jgi:hypothetical protein
VIDAQTNGWADDRMHGWVARWVVDGERGKHGDLPPAAIVLYCNLGYCIEEDDPGWVVNGDRRHAGQQRENGPLPQSARVEKRNL